MRIIGFLGVSGFIALIVWLGTGQEFAQPPTPALEQIIQSSDGGNVAEDMASSPDMSEPVYDCQLLEYKVEEPGKVGRSKQKREKKQTVSAFEFHIGAEGKSAEVHCSGGKVFTSAKQCAVGEILTAQPIDLSEDPQVLLVPEPDRPEGCSSESEYLLIVFPPEMTHIKFQFACVPDEDEERGEQGEVFEI